MSTMAALALDPLAKHALRSPSSIWALKDSASTGPRHHPYVSDTNSQQLSVGSGCGVAKPFLRTSSASEDIAAHRSYEI